MKALTALFFSCLLLSASSTWTQSSCIISLISFVSNLELLFDSSNSLLEYLLFAELSKFTYELWWMTCQWSGPFINASSDLCFDELNKLTELTWRLSNSGLNHCNPENIDAEACKSEIKELRMAAAASLDTCKASLS
jgi:hypothetical protein